MAKVQNEHNGNLDKVNSVEDNLFNIALFADIAISAVYFIKFEPRIVFSLIFIIATVCIIGAFTEKRKHYITPLLDLIIKVVLFVASVKTDGSFFDEATNLSFLGIIYVFVFRPAVIILILFVVYGICFLITCMVTKKKRDDNMENKVIDDGNKYAKQMSKPLYAVAKTSQEQIDQSYCVAVKDEKAFDKTVIEAVRGNTHK